MKWGAGAGVRYLSPIGPLRFEIGWKLEREPYEDPYVWFFSIGNPF
jgi:outer membrane protein insertion porin family